jgi:glycerophosphoryl diester phosphodiesterase
MLPETLDVRERPVTLIHHAANCRNADPMDAPPGSLSALANCLTQGAKAVEIDLIPLSDQSFALLHDRDLARDTDGQGDAPKSTRSRVEKLHYRVGGEITGEKVGFLEEALGLLQDHPDTRRLQIDLKPFAPLTRAVLRRFLELIDPIRERIQVSSVSDWGIRALASFAPELSLGFDPLLYLDLVGAEPRPEGIPPFRVGAYGLADDHPLSAYQWGPLGDYFAARAGALLVQAPPGCTWFLRATLLDKALQAGFDWIAFLHQHGSRVDAWTIDGGEPEQVALAQKLVERGVDDLTTDNPTQLAARLAAEVDY